MLNVQKEILISPKHRGFNLITNEILTSLPEISRFETGITNIFIKHTSASISLSENADPSVRSDLESFFNRIVPETFSDYEHTDEGPDDMTSHIKNVMIGCSIMIPVTKGRFNLGTWQGIYLCEHRNHSSGRKLVITIFGEERK